MLAVSRGTWGKGGTEGLPISSCEEGLPDLWLMAQPCCFGSQCCPLLHVRTGLYKQRFPRCAVSCSLSVGGLGDLLLHR